MVGDFKKQRFRHITVTTKLILHVTNTLKKAQARYCMEEDNYPV